MASGRKTIPPDTGEGQAELDFRCQPRGRASEMELLVKLWFVRPILEANTSAYASWQKRKALQECQFLTQDRRVNCRARLRCCTRVHMQPVSINSATTSSCVACECES